MFDLGYSRFRGLEQIGNNERTGYWFIWTCGLLYRITWHRLVFDIYKDVSRLWFEGFITVISMSVDEIVHWLDDAGLLL